MQDELVGTIGFHAVKTAKAKPAKAKTARPRRTKHYAQNIADKLQPHKRQPQQPRLYDPSLRGKVDIINPPYDDTHGDVQSLTVEKRLINPVYHCAIYPSQLHETRRDKRAKQRQNRKVARRLRAIAKAG